MTRGKQRGRVIDMEPSFLIQGRPRDVDPGCGTWRENRGRTGRTSRRQTSSGFAVSWKLRVTSTRQIVTLLTKVEGGRGWVGLPEE